MNLFKLISIYIILFTACASKGSIINVSDKTTDTVHIFQCIVSDAGVVKDTVTCNTHNEIPFEQIIGYWRHGDCGAYIDICKTRSFCEVVNNQIAIFTLLKRSEKNRYNVYYHSICDLGRGGAALDWDNFSKTIPIARINFMNATTADFEWLGFFDKKKERYVFKESDFNSFLDTSTARLSKWPINNALKEWKELMKKTYDGNGD